MKRPPARRVLLVEDNPGDADLVRIALADQDPHEFVVTHATRLSAALELLAGAPFDVVLLDLGLPDADGLETIRRTKAARPETPVVVLTGLADKATGIAALEAGALTYVVKGWEAADELVRHVRMAIFRRRALGDLAAVGSSLENATARLRKLDARAKKP